MVDLPFAHCRSSSLRLEPSMDPSTQPGNDQEAADAPATIQRVTTSQNRPSLVKSLGRPGITLVVAALLALLASFLPWASFLAITVYGIEGDGKVTAVASGLYAGALLLDRSGTRGARRAAIVGGGIVGAIHVFVAATDWTQFAAVGMWLLLLAGIAMLAAAVWAAAAGAWNDPPAG